MSLDLINFDDEPEDERHSFPCACGEPDCLGWDDDVQNIRIGSSWWAADCRNKPLAIAEDQDRAFRADQRWGK